MAQDEGRVIKPPMDQVTSGRVFHPDNAFLYKKWLRVFIIVVLIWAAIFVFMTLLNDPEFLSVMLDLAFWTEAVLILG